MSSDEAIARLRFRRVVGGLAYLLVGGMIFAWLLGPDLLGHRGGFAADMAAVALPVLVIIWLVCFPFFLLLGYTIQTVARLISGDDEKIKLR